MSAPKILPATWDRDTGPVFAAAAENRLAVRSCTACGRGNHVPTPTCRFCAADTEWVDAAGTGTLYSWSTVTHAVHPGFPVPYTIVAVTLDDLPDIRMVGHIEGAPELSPGQPMAVWFEARADAEGRPVVLPNWRPA